MGATKEARVVVPAWRMKTNHRAELLRCSRECLCKHRRWIFYYIMLLIFKRRLLSSGQLKTWPSTYITETFLPSILPFSSLIREPLPTVLKITRCVRRWVRWFVLYIEWSQHFDIRKRPQRRNPVNPPLTHALLSIAVYLLIKHNALSNVGS